MTITAKYAGTCTKCHQPINVGEQIEWMQGCGARHTVCPERPAQPETRTIRTGGLPMGLETGEVWAVKNNPEDVVVILSTQSANWRGEDRDVYGHIDTWYTVRPATEQEQSLWADAVTAMKARREQRKRLSADRFEYMPDSGILRSNQTRLDSYDDRWNPPADVILTPEEIAIEEAAISTRNALKGHGG